MKQSITLDIYLLLGGLLSKVDWTKSELVFSGDENYRQEIVSFQDKNETNTVGGKQFWFTFKNGKTARYWIHWVTIEVEVVLDEYHTKDAYVYRGLPITESPHNWHVGGSYKNERGSGGGVIEWCRSEEDAFEMLEKMKNYSEFSDLQVSNYL